MALVIELWSTSGERRLLSRHVLNEKAVTLGRSLQNALVLDDPYVDAFHARIELESGGFSLKDLGSKNGVIRTAGAVGTAPGVLEAGSEYLIGRTLLRVRDADEAVPPALLEVDERAVKLDGKPSMLPSVAFIVAAAASVVLYSWLGTYSKSSETEIVGYVVAYVAVAFLWAGGWSMSSRITTHEFRFIAHLGVFSSIVLLFLAVGLVSDWGHFILPFDGFFKAFDKLVGLSIFALLIASHLAISSRLRLWPRWRAGLLAAGALGAIMWFGEMVGKEVFSASPQFSDVLKPSPVPAYLTVSPEEFKTFSRGLRAEVDRLAEKK